MNAPDAPQYRIVPLEGEAELASAVAAMHEELLAHSPVVLLGRRFMERFYYSTLPGEGEIFGHVAFVAGEPAGFIVATADPGGFMSRAIRRHALRLAWLIGTSLVARPSGIVGLWESIQINRNLPDAGTLRGTGEILSFGVREPYRKRRFIRQTGLRVSHDLMDSIVAAAAAHGCQRLRSLVDQDNTEARLFYRGLDWQLGEPDIPGWKQPVVEYYVDLRGNP